MREVFDLQEVVQAGKQAACFDIEAGFFFGITTINAHFDRVRSFMLQDNFYSTFLRR